MTWGAPTMPGSVYCAREIDPDNAAIHKRLGRMFHQAGELAEATQAFGLALSHDAEDGETQLLQATLLPEFTASEAEREEWRSRYRKGLERVALDPPAISDPMEVGATGFYLPTMAAMTGVCRRHWREFTQAPVRRCSSLRAR